MTDAMIAFLNARLDEDEEAAKGPPGWKLEHWSTVHYKISDSGREWRVDAEPRCVVDAVAKEDAAHIARHDPAAVLASVAADRRLLAELEACQGDIGWDDALMFAARCRAMAWNSHPGYKLAWKP